MLKDANATGAPCAHIDVLPPGIFERAKAVRENKEKSAHADNLRHQVRSVLAEADHHRELGFTMAADTYERDLLIPLRELIEMGEF